MAYTTRDFKTKKALKAAVAGGEIVMVETDLGGHRPNVAVYLEGPHYPAPHTWYAKALVDGRGRITKVVS